MENSTLIDKILRQLILQAHQEMIGSHFSLKYPTLNLISHMVKFQNSFHLNIGVSGIHIV